MRAATVLVVDDEARIRDVVRTYLERDGYSVLVADNGERALEAAARIHPDLVVLDLRLPDMPGEEVARTLHSSSAVPIIMLTAKAAEDERVAGLRAGADDYITKPFSPRELAARVEAVLRRTNAATDAPLSFGGGALEIDRQARRVAVDGVNVELTRSEFEILLALAARPGRVYSRLELIARLQAHDYDGYERTIDAHLKNLRRKLGDDPRRQRFIETVIGVGYRLALRRDA